MGISTEDDVKIHIGVNTEMHVAETSGVCDILGMDRTEVILSMSQKIKRKHWEYNGY